MLCHEHDKTSAVAHECHVLGHSKESTEASCLAKRPACVEACGASEPPAGEQQPGGKEFRVSALDRVTFQELRIRSPALSRVGRLRLEEP
jgi:hypothetical protein